MSTSSRLIQRRFHGQARDETIDSAGRVRLPGHMTGPAGLEGACVVVGVDDHLEVWHPDRWAEQLKRVDAEIERLMNEQQAKAG